MKRVFSLMVLLLCLITAHAQIPQKLPLDPKVKSGKLENGLSYFIMKNGNPKGQADFFIAQKVGSILEEENQRGLAHFLEHMAFNGTKNFPGNSLITYLQKIGVKFGENLNAYTAIDQTVYNISAVPIKRDGIIDSCLLILHDWANEILLKEEEIDKERGVIREELRTRSNAQMRMFEALLPEAMGGSKYGDRLPAGLVEVIDNFTYKELKDYYSKWYRPDLQGIIIVGDINPEAIEGKIKKVFSKIPKPVNAAKREKFYIDDNQQPIIAIASDPEATITQLSLMYKKEPMESTLQESTSSLVYDYLNTLVTSMLNSRLYDLAQTVSPPFAAAESSYSNFIVANTKEAFEINAEVKEGEEAMALRAIITEAQRMKEHGFTQDEFERAKAIYTNSLERLYKEREKLNHSYFTEKILDHFLENRVLPGIETEYALMQQIVSLVTLEQVNSYANSIPTKENVVILIMGPNREGVAPPLKEQVLELYNNTIAATVEPYQDSFSKQPLISDLAPAGKIISETPEPMSGGKVWNLSNGATVVIKKTDYKEDQILFNASSKGGSSLFEVKDLSASLVLSDLISIGGMGSFSASDLRKILAGKSVTLNSQISLTRELIEGDCSPKDLETLMQLLYLQFTSIREDEQAYQSWYSRMEAQLKSIAANPMVAFSDTLQKVIYNNSPYSRRLDLDILSTIDYKRALTLARERYSNAADFVFTFVGNIDESYLKQLVEVYIGSLPANKGRKESWNKVDLNYAKGKVIKEFDREMQTPKSTLYSITTGEIPYTLENLIMSKMATQIFDLLFTRTIREQEQGTYGVTVDIDLNFYPSDNYLFLFGFDTDTALKERLLKRAYSEIDKLLAEGIDKEDFGKVVTFMHKEYTQNQLENEYWLNLIATRFLLGRDLHTTYLATLNSITPQQLHGFITKILSSKNRVEIIMNGIQEQNKESDNATTYDN